MEAISGSEQNVIDRENSKSNIIKKMHYANMTWLESNFSPTPVIEPRELQEFG